MKTATRVENYIDEAKFTNFATLASLSLTSDNSLRVTLNRLVKKGVVYNPLRGTYVSKEADMFWIACQMYQGYVSLSAAFYLHQLVDEFPFTVFVGSEVRKSLTMGNMEFLYFKANNYRGIENLEYPVASVEKAIYDSFTHPWLVDYRTLSMVLHRANISSAKIIGISAGEESAFFQRLGYMLSMLPRLDKEKAKLVSFCRGRVRSNVYLLGRQGGTYIPEWKIVDNIGKEVLLSWWRQ